jgi:hypothetical protein
MEQEGKMDAELKAKWVVTLRKGAYEQGRSQLRDRANRCCCLGVLCDIINPDGWELPQNRNSWRHRGHDVYPSDEISKIVGLDSDTVRKLGRMNDAGGSFPEIAAWIEQNL